MSNAVETELVAEVVAGSGGAVEGVVCAYINFVSDAVDWRVTDELVSLLNAAAAAGRIPRLDELEASTREAVFDVAVPST